MTRINDKWVVKWDFEPFEKYAELDGDFEIRSNHNMVDGLPTVSFTFGGWRFWLSDAQAVRGVYR
jgi:hypothetical protein